MTQRGRRAAAFASSGWRSGLLLVTLLHGSLASPSEPERSSADAILARLQKASCKDGDTGCTFQRETLAEMRSRMQRNLPHGLKDSSQQAGYNLVQRQPRYSLNNKHQLPVNHTNVILFLHVSKGGGTTMCHLAHNQPSVHVSDFQYAHHCNPPKEGYEQGRQYNWREPLLNSCEAIFEYNRNNSSDYMHVETSFHRGIKHCQNVIYTMLVRDPIERILSHLSAWHIPVLDMTKILSGRLVPEPLDWPKQPGVFDNLYIRFLLGDEAFSLPPGRVTRAHLEEAKQLLASLDLVIPLPKLTRDIWPVLNKVLGWESKYLDKQGQDMPVLNARHPPVVSRNVLVNRFRTRYPLETAMLEKRNHFDKLLYEYANQLFLERWERPMK